MRFGSRGARAALAVTSILLLVLTACSSGGGRAQSVSARATTRAGKLELRRGFTLSWGNGVFKDEATVTGSPIEAPAPPPPWFVPDGEPVDVTIDGPRYGLLDVSWRPPSPPPEVNLVPVVLHWNEATRLWESVAVGEIAAGATGSSGSFSPYWPGWASPKKLAAAVSGAVRNGLGKRTDPPGCSGGPSWAELSPPPVDVVLTCLTTNRAADGTERAEVQLRNNRGYLLEVAVPPGAAYAFVDGQPELIRAAARAFTNRDSVLLSPGQLMTIGLAQPNVGVPVRINAAPTIDALAAYVVSEAIGETDGVLAVIKVLADCPLGTNLPFDLKPSIDTVTGVVRAAVDCFTGLFTDPAKAELLAREIVAAEAQVDTTTVSADRSLASKAARLAAKVRLAAVAVKVVDVGADVIDAIADEYVNSSSGDYTGMSTVLGLRGNGAPKTGTATLPQVTMTQQNVGEFERVLRQGGITFTDEDDAACSVIEVLGIDFAAGSVDLMLSRVTEGQRGVSCGGDTVSTFERIRSGVAVETVVSCGDCENDPGAAVFQQRTAAYRGRKATVIYPEAQDGTWRVWSYEEIAVP